ncbi:hypothetical protein EPIR_2409 [Erwinia piriflorinigrans CFBP 5888]|uniref:Uncharacterized protein n=1 Tax=Erwinia piriflorinigrans CFBP 5888 TaxID=1161919 RepID=V5Z952_9GAMM|nr:hypothetical protein EPIR_2409 [Erwinia piriflorinigrans CFBP 5888]
MDNPACQAMTLLGRGDNRIAPQAGSDIPGAWVLHVIGLF